MGKLKIDDFNSSNSDEEEINISKDIKAGDNLTRNQITVSNKLNFKRSRSNIEF